MVVVTVEWWSQLMCQFRMLGSCIGCPKQPNTNVNASTVSQVFSFAYIMKYRNRSDTGRHAVHTPAMKTKKIHVAVRYDIQNQFISRITDGQKWCAKCGRKLQKKCNKCKVPLHERRFEYFHANKMFFEYCYKQCTFMTIIYELVKFFFFFQVFCITAYTYIFLVPSIHIYVINQISITIWLSS